MILVLPEILLPMLLAFGLGLMVGRLIWRRPGTESAQQPVHSLAVETQTSQLDVVPSEAISIDAKPVSIDLTNEPRMSTLNQSSLDTKDGESTVVSLADFSDALVTDAPDLITLQDDLSASEADLVMAKEDLVATHKMLKRAESELARVRNEKGIGATEKSQPDFHG